MKVSYKPGLKNFLECFLSSTFAQIITVLHENFQKCLKWPGKEGERGGGGRLAPPASTPMLFSYGHLTRTTGTTETTIWQPGFIRKMKTARKDYMQTRLITQVFLHVAQQGDFID